MVLYTTKRGRDEVVGSDLAEVRIIVGREFG
jgi:hypothetical protein